MRKDEKSLVGFALLRYSYYDFMQNLLPKDFWCSINATATTIALP